MNEDSCPTLTAAISRSLISAINRENVQRRIVVQANVSGRDLGSVVAEIQKKINEQVHLPTGFFISYEGQFQSQQEATRLIGILSIVTLATMFLVLYSTSAAG